MSVERLVSTLPVAVHVTNYLQVRYYADLLRELEIKASELGLKFMGVENSQYGRTAGLEGYMLKAEVLSELAGAISAKRMLIFYPKLDEDSIVNLIIAEENDGYSLQLINEIISALADGGYFLVDTTEDVKNLENNGRFFLK